MTDQTTNHRPSTLVDVGRRGGLRRPVLFVCTGNAARSQMAEGWLRMYGHDYFDVQSAGTEPRECVDPFAVRTMSECGLDMSDQRPKDVWQFVAEPWDFVITTCDRANENCPVFPGVNERIHWSFRDPAAVQGSEAERLEVFRRVREEILLRVRLFVAVQTRARR
jgi:arsenate reductase (thioredoxin)